MSLLVAMANIDQARQVYDLIRDCPGVGPSDIARGLGISVSMVTNSLICMERLELYVSQDERGRLYPFDSMRVIDVMELLGV